MDEAKKKKLCETRSLNPRPGRVRDELFLSNDFFDADDVIQVKYEMIRRVGHDGWAVEQACKTFGFSRPTFYEVQKVIEEDGIAGLIPRKKGPREGHKLTDEVMKFVEQQLGRKERPSISLLATRIREQFGITIHRRSLERALNRRKKKR